MGLGVGNVKKRTTRFEVDPLLRRTGTGLPIDVVVFGDDFALIFDAVALAYALRFVTDDLFQILLDFVAAAQLVGLSFDQAKDVAPGQPSTVFAEPFNACGRTG